MIRCEENVVTYVWRAAVVAAALAVTGCAGGDTEPVAAPTQTVTVTATVTATPSASMTASPESDGPGDQVDPALAERRELGAAVQSYSDAFLTGKAESAYGHLSSRCRGVMPFSEFTVIVEAAGELYGDPLPWESFEADIEGDRARVTYTYELGALDQVDEPWLREDGSW